MSSYIFTLLGTGGDVWPGMAIAGELSRRGHDVVVLSYDYFSDEAKRLNIRLISVGASESYLAHVTTASFWERHGTSKGLDEDGYLRQALQPVYDYIVARRAMRPFLVCTRNAYGARFAAEKFDLPLLCLAFSSTQFASVDRFPYSAPRLRMLPRWLRRLSLGWGDRLYNQPLLKTINPLRNALELPPIRQMRDWSFFSAPSLALYPAWYNSVDDLAHHGVRQADFVFPRNDESARLPPAVETFLRFGDAPVVFTFGTGVGHVQEVFAKAVTALEQIGRRGIFVTKFPQNLPQDVGNSLTVPYVDFSALLPRVALVVHHGGIGTAAQALRAGIPQVIVPLAFDQPDNAYRLKSLGLAEFVPGMDVSVAKLRRAMQRAIERAQPERLQAVRSSLLRSDGRSLAADHCEEFFAARKTASANPSA